MKHRLYTIEVVICLTLAGLILIGWIGSLAFPWHATLTWSGARGPNGGIELETERVWQVGLDQGFLRIQPIGSFYEWKIPLWKFVAVLVALPVLSARAFRVRPRRSKPGRCVGCGYDLRESPDRCPECGRAREQTT